MRHPAPEYRRRGPALAALTVWAALGWRGAAPHHSFGGFDLTRTETIRGDVVAFEWVNPHTWTRVSAADADGDRVVWRFEGMSPGYLGRRGWNRYTLGEGDAVEIVFYPFKNGDPGGLLVRAILADGTVKVMVTGTALR